MAEDVGAAEAVWQARWKAAGLGRAHYAAGRPKFSIVFAYPGTSGFMHLGHMRGYTYADVIARFHRMKGEEVFFPAGIHASGLPAITFAGKVAARDPDTVAGLFESGASEPDLARLEDPVAASQFLSKNYWKVWESFGLVLDESANVSTVDPDYQQFIRWQFQRLQRLGHLVQKPYFAPYCPRSGPVSVDPSETDLDRGGNAEVVAYTALPFRLPDGRLILCATLRPETVYGVTNLWVAPGSHLVEWKHEGRTYLVSDSGVAKLLEQWGGERGAVAPVSSLLNTSVSAPLTSETVPVLESRLVDPEVGSGAVMSVPAHAPADWVALQELPEPLRSKLTESARVLLELPPDRLAPSERALFQGEGPPAAQAVRVLGVKDLSDSARLQEATERVYRAEHSHGVMTVAPYAGRGVEEARRAVAEEAKKSAGAVEVREFSEPVVCRCGASVIIRRVPDQWFLAYGDPQWKSVTRELVQRVRTYPAEYQGELSSILDWFDDRPAVRKGKWLGTPFPQDPSWVIEPIADSTFYPAYYVVRRFVAARRISVEQLTPAFFDFVFCGEGDGECSLPRELQEEVRREFLYFYPLDVNLGGKEHKRVHFPVFLYTHAALSPPELQPRGIFVNWWIVGGSGKKLSKKDVKGGTVPTVGHGLSSWGADGVRLYFATASTPFQDVEWDLEACERAGDRAREVLRQLQELFGVDGLPPGSLEVNPRDHLSRWFSTALAQAVGAAREAFEENDLRRAAEVVYVEVPSLLRKYRARGGSHPGLLRTLAEVWVRMLSPVTPHLAEEAGQGHVPGFVMQEHFPSGAEFPSYPEALAREALQDGLEDDLSALLKTWKTPAAELRIFVAAPWKRLAETALRSALSAGASPDVGGAMKALREVPELRAYLGRLPELLKLYDLRALAVATAAAAAPPEPGDELEQWSSVSGYLCSRFGLGKVSVYTEEHAAPHDPKNRRGRARPGRPALFLVENAPAVPPTAG